MQGYSLVQHDVANLSPHDLLYAEQLFEKESYRMHGCETPIIRGLISANVRAKDGNYLSPPPYVIKEISGPRFPRRADGKLSWRIGVVGLTEPDQSVSARLSGFKMDDPLISARRAILQARSQCDLLVVLAYLPEETVFKLLELNPGIDVVIAPRGRWGRSYQRNHGMVVYADRQTQMLGELRIYVDETGKVKNISDRMTLLDNRIPDDPDAAQLVSAAHEQIEATQKMQLGPQYAPVTTTPLASGLFVTSETCGTCHHQEFALWKESGHAHAFATLEKRRQQFDLSCIGCHTTGYQQGGFMQALLTPQLSNVQCESCHGPGQSHIADPVKPYGQVVTPDACIICHTPTHDPEFNFVAYWSKIKH